MTAQPTTPFPFRDLPEGTVTFLFSDIEGSTQLLYRLGDRFKATLAEHHRILREAVAHGGGHVVGTEGDSFFVAFPRATNAVAAAVEAQRALAQYPWPEGAPVRVRMGLHTGEAEVALDSYVGIAVHRAARIAHVGHGGQVLLSETTTALVGDELPAGVTLLDLGRHLLKDIRRPERICQLQVEGLPSEFPPLNSLGMLPPEGARLPRPVGPCPYRGLAAFREADAPFYCGREAFVDLLEQAVRRQALTAVIVGSSGSGKSSALFAGLLPRLRKEGGWRFALLRPGAQPFYALAGALLPLLEAGLSKTDRLTETGKLAERLAHGKEVRLVQVVERIHEDSPGTRQILLVVDQFEELYTLCPDAKVQQAFINELLATAAAGKERRPPSCVILLTLRADFMGQALAYRPFADALQEGSLLIGPMTRQELRVAIEKPAEMQGAAFEAGLVERILDDVGDKPGNLPLLEFTLTLLWEQQTDGWLTHTHYEAMGSVEGALAAYADQVYAELQPGEQERARRALVQLVRPGEGTEDTRRVATREELGDENWKLIQHLADRRLVVTGRDAAGHEMAEVVHEALIQRWGRFREWMDADRAFRAWQERLRGNLRQWQESKQDEGALLGGAPLLVAENWLAERTGELSEAEQQFIQGGVALREQKAAEREAQRQRELELARKLARQAAILLAGQAETELANGYHDRAVLLALEALVNYPYTPQAEHALGQAVTLGRAKRFLAGHTSTVGGVAWSPDGKQVATTSTDQTVRIWDVATGKEVKRLAVNNQAYTVAWSPVGNTLLYTTGDRFLAYRGDQGVDVFLWDIRQSTPDTLYTAPAYPLFTAEGNSNGVSEKLVLAENTNHSAAFSPDGQRLAFITDQTVSLWDVARGKAVLELAGHTDFVYSVAWSPDGQRMLSAGEDHTARIWDAADGRALQTLSGHTQSVAAAVFSPDGARVATSSRDGAVIIWEADTGRQLLKITVDGKAIWDVAWSPDGKRLATANESGMVQVWDTATGQVTFALRGHEGQAVSVAWSADGRHLLSGSKDARAYIWKATPGTEAFALEDPSGTTNSADWTPDGRRILTGGGNWLELSVKEGVVREWDAETGKQLRALEPAFDDVLQVAFSPDGRCFCTRQDPGISGMDVVLVWDYAQGEIINTIPVVSRKTGAFIRDAAWSLDGKRIAAVTSTGLAKVYDAFTGQELASFTGHPAGTFIITVEWSPDGKWIGTAGGREKLVRIWDAQTGQERMTLEHKDYAVFVKWSPAGGCICTASGGMEGGGTDNVIRLWDAQTGELRRVIYGHTAGVIRCSWSPDGRRLYSCGDDTTRIWDAATGAELLRLPSPSTGWEDAFWSPDGKYLATVGNNQPARLWRVWQSTQELIDYARACCVIRELTAKEREQFGLP